MRQNSVKKALKEGKTSLGTWLSLGSIVASRYLARAGFDWLTLDAEHSMVDWETACHVFGSIADAGCVALCRVPSNRHDHIKRALDNGAMGVVVPMVNSREEALAAVAACKYPPVGNRSVGGGVPALNFNATGGEYFEKANDEILVVLQCEHIDAVNRADEIFSVPGIDAIFVGPNDLAWSMRDPSGKSASADAFNCALRTILATCQKHGVAPGIHCMNLADAQLRLEQGWKFLALTSELRMMLDGTEAMLKPLGLGAGKAGARY